MKGMESMLYNYYTKADTAYSILTGGIIWATNIKYMNDFEEFLNGLNEIKKYRNGEIPENQLMGCIRELEKLSNVKLYTISLCGRSDALSQWSMYAKESGVCIEMDLDKYKDISYEIIDDELECKYPLKYKHVIYCTADSGAMSESELKSSQEEIKILLESCCSNDQGPTGMQESVSKCAALIKRYEFFQEDEYRAIFNINNSGQKCIGFRMDKGVLKSYVKVKCFTNGEIGWPVNSIMIGPGFNQDVVFNSWMFVLDNAILKIPSMNKDDYLKRISDYFTIAIEKFPPDIQEELNQTVNQSLAEWKKDFSVENPEFSYIIHSHLDDLIKELTQRATSQKDNTEEKLSEYWKSNYFSRSGIILKKSSIPYIF